MAACPEAGGTRFAFLGGLRSRTCGARGRQGRVGHAPRSVSGVGQQCAGNASACNDRLGPQEQVRLLPGPGGMSRAVSTYLIAAEPDVALAR